MVDIENGIVLPTECNISKKGLSRQPAVAGSLVCWSISVSVSISSDVDRGVIMRQNVWQQNSCSALIVLGKALRHACVKWEVYREIVTLLSTGLPCLFLSCFACECFLLGPGPGHTICFKKETFEMRYNNNYYAYDFNTLWLKTIGAIKLLKKTKKG